MDPTAPIDPQGHFAIRQILPPDRHAVEITLNQTAGNQTFIRRNVTILDNDWLYVALGDLTIGRNKVTSPAGLVMGDTQHYEDTHRPQSVFPQGPGSDSQTSTNGGFGFNSQAGLATTAGAACWASSASRNTRRAMANCKRFARSAIGFPAAPICGVPPVSPSSLGRVL